MSPEFLRRAVRVPASPDSDLATGQTVEIMVGHIQESASDPLLIGCARSAVAQYRGGPFWAIRGINPFNSAQCGDDCRVQAIAESVWWWAKHQLKFVHHSKLIEVWLNERDQLQLLISPDVLVRTPFRMVGDCAIYSMLIPAMLESLGVPWELVTAAVDPRQPEMFTHVWARAILPNGRRLDLDASHGKYPGWHVPVEHISRLQVWDESGVPIEDAAGETFRGLHGYQKRRRGLGDATSDALDVPDMGGSIDLGGSSSIPILPPVITPESDFQPGSVTAPSQNSAQWASFANTLAKSGLTLAEINAIQPGTVVGPNGQILRQSPGYAVPVGSPLNSLTGSLGGISTGTLLLGAAAIFGVVLVAKH